MESRNIKARIIHIETSLKSWSHHSYDLSNGWSPSVCITVNLHVDFLVETFATEWTDKWFEVGVRSHVSV